MKDFSWVEWMFLVAMVIIGIIAVVLLVICTCQGCGCEIPWAVKWVSNPANPASPVNTAMRTALRF